MSLQDQLKELHRQAQDQQRARVAEEAAAAKKRQAEADVDFAAAMADVVPLKTAPRYTPPRDQSPIKVRDKSADNREAGAGFFIGEGGYQLDIPAAFSKNGQGSKDIQRLQAGHWEVVADVDLHGYTQEAAQTVLNEFIDFVRARGVCGEIIHGSGLGSAGYTPVLKNLVRRWLMQHPDVLAYCEPRKGNDGAVRILLKRKRREDPWAE